MSDTSPIRVLSFLGLLPVLNDLFDRVFIPPAVAEELLAPLPRFDIVNLTSFEFITIKAPRDLAQVERFLLELDRGESEAMAVALEMGAKLLLMDERRGRSVAATHGIVPIGTLGILLRAKSQGIVPAVAPHVDRLFGLGFFISEELKNEVLRLAGE